MTILGVDPRRAALLAFVFAAMACGGGMGGGMGGCGPALDADKIAADAKGSAAAGAAEARAKMGDALIQKGDGYEKGAFANLLSGFAPDGSTLPGSPKSEFARLAQSLPPTPENQKLIEQALGQDNAHHGKGDATDLAGNGGYVTVVDGADGKPRWQWNAYDGSHPAPKGFEKPYVPPAGYTGQPSPATASGSGSSTAATDPALTPPPGTTGCWPKPPGLHHINLHLMGGNGNRRVVDSTPIVCSGSYCSAIGFSGRGCCPLRPEGDPMRVQCEGEVLGKNPEGKIGPRWTYKGNGSVLVQPGNPFLAWAYGNGWVGACSNISPVCNWKEVINHPELLGGTTSQTAGGGGGGSSGSPAGSSGSAPRSAPGTPLKSSTDTAPGNSNLESLIPTIPEVEPATNTPPN